MKEADQSPPLLFLALTLGLLSVVRTCCVVLARSDGYQTGNPPLLPLLVNFLLEKFYVLGGKVSEPSLA